jgi:hypothetical protein
LLLKQIVAIQEIFLLESTVESFAPGESHNTTMVLVAKDLVGGGQTLQQMKRMIGEPIAMLEMKRIMMRRITPEAVVELFVTPNNRLMEAVVQPQLNLTHNR